MAELRPPVKLLVTVRSAQGDWVGEVLCPYAVGRRTTVNPELPVSAFVQHVCRIAFPKARFSSANIA